MSKQWTIGIGVVAGVLVLCLVWGGGFVMGRVSSFAAMRQAGVPMPNPRGFDQPGQFEGRDRGNPDTPAKPPQLEVTLIDDDEDGIPDRGVVELPPRPDFNRGDEGRFNDRMGPPQNFGRGFDPGQRPFSRVPFLPLVPLGGLIFVATLAALAVLGVVLYRRRSSPSAPTAASPIVDMPSEEIDTPEDAPIQEEPDEIDMPEDVEAEVESLDDDEAEPETPSN